MIFSGVLAPPPRWTWVTAVAAGVLGLLANVLLVGFFVLTWPYYFDLRWNWLGPANDIVLIGFFGALVPVVVAVRRLLPASRIATIGAVGGVAALVGLVVLQVALVAGWLSFPVQVRFVIGLLVVVYGWLVLVSSVGHRSGRLPRSLTRFGLLLGVSWLAAMACAAAGVALGGSLWYPQLELPAALLLLPGVVLGGLNWLLLPLWPLVLARTTLRGRAVPSEPSTQLSTAPVSSLPKERFR